MVDANPLSHLWKDSMTAVGYKSVENPNGSTGFEEIIIAQDIPCKLSFATIRAAEQDGGGAALAQTVKLFCDKGVRIEPGSKLDIKRGEHTFEYSQSGLPAIFSRHQEIVLSPFHGWA